MTNGNQSDRIEAQLARLTEEAAAARLDSNERLDQIIALIRQLNELQRQQSDRLDQKLDRIASTTEQQSENISRLISVVGQPVGRN